MTKNKAETSGETEARMASRRELIRQQRVARERRNQMIYGGAGLVVILGVAAVFWYSTRTIQKCDNLQGPIQALHGTLPKSLAFPQAGVKLLSTPYSRGLPEPGPEETRPQEATQHVSLTIADLPFQKRPPTSGPHYDTPAPYRYNDKEVPEGNWVHSMEHGAVVLLYDCGTGRVAAVAWNHILPMAGVDTAKITEFYNKYVDKGPEAVP